ncbi:hypothetical protein NEISICOT_00725 [Neisseria sicca ATCC 29256]|uniref:Uncharacterized protein n=1 Tax=Neisseria sicca ATCC 29256 TaxID=547045 RepID=C6M2I6_NEISI|nr:hypothetical protein NEISICOT_00725 [Neisseria sicca ATCC 29256]
MNIPKIFRRPCILPKRSSENADSARQTQKSCLCPNLTLFFVCLTKGLRYHAGLLQDC